MMINNAKEVEELLRIEGVDINTIPTEVISRACRVLTMSIIVSQLAKDVDISVGDTQVVGASIAKMLEIVKSPEGSETEMQKKMAKLGKYVIDALQQQPPEPKTDLPPPMQAKEEDPPVPELKKQMKDAGFSDIDNYPEGMVTLADRIIRLSIAEMAAAKHEGYSVMEARLAAEASLFMMDAAISNVLDGKPLLNDQEMAKVYRFVLLQLLPIGTPEVH